MTKPAPKRYRTTNWNAYNRALIQRGSLSVWLDTSMSWQSTPRCTRGRTQTYSAAAIQFCLTIKNLFGLALRQTIGFIQSLLKLAGLDWDIPDYSTLSRRQQTLQVKIPYQKSSGALHLLVDSTGIKRLGEGEWAACESLDSFSDNQEARRRISSAMAQSASGHRGGNPANPRH